MAIPAGRHTDWGFPLSLIPRSWNARESDVGPSAWCESEGYAGNLDIPKPGHWNLSFGEYWEPYFAITFRNSWHFRIGLARYDYVDFYYNYMFFIPTLKKIKF